MRILILEDSKPTQHLLRSRLEKEGYKVDVADNGHQGFQLATAYAYDVILSDILMPHWDGFKFIEAIGVISPHLPILVVTSTLDDHETLDRLHQYDNVLGVLAKPFDFDDLFKRLAAIPRQTHASVNKKAKIVCTIGPSSNTPEILGKMILAGMDVARLNFSHGSYETHEATLLAIREAEKAWEKPIAVLQDLCGPKIRTGPMQGGAIQLQVGEVLVIQAQPIEGTAERISTITPSILADLRVGEPILLDDGLLELRVLKEGAEEVHCEVVVGGTLKSSKGINLPSTTLSLPSVTEKDWQDLDWGLGHSIDYVALSFVRSAEDVWRIKNYVKSSGKRNIKVVAKIEKPEAVQNIHEIIEVADAIMIARGDMGVELPAARVPRIQERIIRLCWELNTPVITATQMLDSMTFNARPTRAEVTDVSVAIKEGTDAVMLSQETATGVDPVNVVRTMASIICEEERHAQPSADFFRELEQDAANYPALSVVANLSTNNAVLLLDPDGSLYPVISKWNRKSPTLLVTKSLHVARHANLYNNIFPLILREELGRTEMVFRSLDMAREWGSIHAGETVAVVEGPRVTRSGIRQLGAVQVIRVEKE
ncbi:MAG: pyruvate kinase [Desulfobulbus sp.]